MAWLSLYLSTGTFASHFFQGRRKFELPKVADKVRLDTPLNHSAAAFSFLVVDAIAAAALCAADSGSIANLRFRVFGHGRLNALSISGAAESWAVPDGLCPACRAS